MQDIEELKNIDSLQNLYKALALQTTNKDKLDNTDKKNLATKHSAELLVFLQSWLFDSLEFDPNTGSALNTGLIDFLEKTKLDLEQAQIHQKDKLFRIFDYVKDAVYKLLNNLNKSVMRENLMLPLNSVKELDSNSLLWLSKKPGINIKQKIANTPYIKASISKLSIDTNENKLLKAFLIRFKELLIEKHHIFTLSAIHFSQNQQADAKKFADEIDDFIVYVNRWLNSEDAKNITAIKTIVPNNRLLQDKFYKKIWNSWLWLNRIDADIKQENQHKITNSLKFIYWQLLAQLNVNGALEIIQAPIFLNYEDFSIQALNIVNQNTAKHTDNNFLLIQSYLSKKNLKSNQQEKTKQFNKIEKIDFLLFDDRIEIKSYTKDLDKEFTIKKASSNKSLNLFKSNEILKSYTLTSEQLKSLVEELFYLISDLKLKDIQQTANKNNNSRQTKDKNKLFLDLYSIRPELNLNRKFQRLPFKFMNQIWYLNKYENKNITQSEFFLDAGTSKCLLLESKNTQKINIKTLSILNLFKNIENDEVNISTKNHLASFFSEKLKSYSKTENLDYTLPDWLSDFETEIIRKNLNLYFSNSKPIPKSIACIFAWQNSQKFDNLFKNSNKSKNIIILAVDINASGIYITPIEGEYNQQLHKFLPKTQGIIWTRHPNYEIENTKPIFKKYKKVLELLTLNDLNLEADKLSFIIDDKHLSLNEIMQQENFKNFFTEIEKSEIDKALKSTDLNSKNTNNIYILPLSNKLRLKNYRQNSNSNWIKSNLQSVKGLQVLDTWQTTIDEAGKEAQNILLWQDSLPDLAIEVSKNNKLEKHYLVKNNKIQPLFKKEILIEIEESFTLPAQKEFYEFNLIQGKNSKKSEYVAYLKSDDMPFAQDVDCNLNMTYTYAADTTYNLKFIPKQTKNQKGLKEIKVEWRLAQPKQLKDLPIPIFPKVHSWQELKTYTKNNGEETDLIEWVERTIDNEIKSVDNLLFNNSNSPEKSKHAFNNIVFRQDINSNKYFFLKMNKQDIFFHQNEFESSQEFNNFVQKIQAGEKVTIYFTIENSNKKDNDKNAKNIGFSPIFTKYINKLTDNIKQIKSLRFPLLTIWNGHSLTDIDAPDSLRKKINLASKLQLKIFQEQHLMQEYLKFEKDLKQEAEFFLSTLHKDTPQEFVKFLQENFNQIYFREIAYAIGDAKLDWQAQLFNDSLKLITQNKNYFNINKGLNILAISLWRNKELIFKLNHKNFNQINKCLIEQLKKQINNKQINKKDYKNITSYLELLLALIRSRESKETNINQIFRPKNQITEEYLQILNQLENPAYKLESRLDLAVEKPAEFSKTPDLIYALKMYLTGDTGANTIIIKGINEEK